MLSFNHFMDVCPPNDRHPALHFVNDLWSDKCAITLNSFSWISPLNCNYLDVRSWLVAWFWQKVRVIAKCKSWFWNEFTSRFNRSRDQRNSCASLCLSIAMLHCCLVFHTGERKLSNTGGNLQALSLCQVVFPQTHVANCVARPKSCKEAIWWVTYLLSKDKKT